MPPAASFCPGCGTDDASADRLPSGWPLTSGYLTFVPAVVLLFLPAFRQSRFVRFHAWQSILLWGVFFVGTVVALFLSNVAAAMVFLLLGIVASLGMLFLWAVLSLKAWQGEQFELPFFGMLALRLR